MKEVKFLKTVRAQTFEGRTSLTHVETCVWWSESWKCTAVHAAPAENSGSYVHDLKDRSACHLEFEIGAARHVNQSQDPS